MLVCCSGARKNYLSACQKMSGEDNSIVSVSVCQLRSQKDGTFISNKCSNRWNNTQIGWATILGLIDIV